jgi:hypothetical protein
VSLVHEQVHQRAKQKNHVRQRLKKKVGPMLREEKVEHCGEESACGQTATRQPKTA